MLGGNPLGATITLDETPKSMVRMAIVLADGFDLLDVSQALASFDLANRLSDKTYFDVVVLTFDDNMAISSLGVSVIATSAWCSAGLRDAILLAGGVADRHRLLPKLIESLGTAKFWQTEPGVRYYDDGLQWLEEMALVHEYDIGAVSAAVRSNRLYNLDSNVIAAVIARHCEAEVVNQVNYAGAFVSEAQTTDERPKRLNDAINLMREHLEEPLSVEHISDAVGCSSRQLLRWFEAYLATTPTQYYSNLRLEHGFQLVLHSNMSVTEIAVACGYQWVGPFSKAFRRRYGQSPRLARKRFQAQRGGATP